MPLTPPQRAWIALALVLCLAIAGGAVYYHHLRKPLPGQVPGAPPHLMSQLPSDAPIVGYIDAAALRSTKESSLVAALMTPASGTQADQEYKQFVDGTGFDYSRDLDRAAMAVWPASLAPTPETVSQDRTLAIADGRFDREKIKSYAIRMHGHEESRGADHFYVVPGAPPVAFEFLSPTRILISSGPDPASILRVSDSGGPGPAMQEEISRVAGAPVFAVARTDKLPESFYSSLKNSPQLGHLARSVQGVTLAAKPDGDSLVVTLEAECDSMKNSLELATLIDGFRMVGSMVMSDPKTRRQMTREQATFVSEVISNTQVTHQDKWVRLALQISPQMLGDTSHAQFFIQDPLWWAQDWPPLSWISSQDSAPGHPSSADIAKVTIREWEVPTPNSRPHDPAIAPDGALWYTGQQANKLGRLDPKTGSFKEYPLTTPDSGPHGLVADIAGDIWFTANYKGYIGKLDPTTGRVTEFPMPDKRATDPHSLVFNREGMIFFTTEESGFVGRLDPATGKISLKKVPTPNANPYGIIVGPDGDIYFCEFGTNTIGKVNPSTLDITEIPLPQGARPRRIASNPDGLIYYSDFARGYLGQLDPKTGKVQEWPSPGGDGSEPYAIASTADGIVWYVETGAKPNLLVAFNPQSKKFQRWPIPSGGGVVRNMVPTPNGDLYLACSGVNKVAVVERRW